MMIPVVITRVGLTRRLKSIRSVASACSTRCHDRRVQRVAACPRRRLLLVRKRAFELEFHFVAH